MGDSRFLETVAANPTGVNMDRVAAASSLCDDLVESRRSVDAAMPALATIAVCPPAPTWQFALAAATAAVALAVIFGIQHASSAIIIFLSAGAGALLRRRLAPLSDNLFLQPFCAALLSGVVGALAVRYQLSSSLRLVAVCPCMVLVPGTARSKRHDGLDPRACRAWSLAPALRHAHHRRHHRRTVARLRILRHLAAGRSPGAASSIVDGHARFRRGRCGLCDLLLDAAGHDSVAAGRRRRGAWSPLGCTRTLPGRDKWVPCSPVSSSASL